MSDATAEEQPTDDEGAAPGAQPSVGAAASEQVSEEEREAIEQERRERLDPENRPENVEVDNTDREFDPTAGQFTDHEPDPGLGPFDDPEAP